MGIDQHISGSADHGSVCPHRYDSCLDKTNNISHPGGRPCKWMDKDRLLPYPGIPVISDLTIGVWLHVWSIHFFLGERKETG